MNLKFLLFSFLAVSDLHVTISDTDWTKECNRCSCIWVSGRRTANCASKGLSEIPKDLSTTIRDIDFSNNPLYSLTENEFLEANLVDIHKMKFQNCSIDTLSEGAFRRLALLIELDLSRNSIGRLKRDTFRDNIKLRILILSYNKIQVLEEGLFSNMDYLQRIHLDNNLIETINEDTFRNLPALNDVNLGYNKIKTITFDLKRKLPKLNSLNVEENPWVCDCNLEQFRQSTIKSNLITNPTKCLEPPKLQGRTWNEPITFACSPVILDPLPSTQIQATSNNVTLSCKVIGDPEPDVDWTNNGHIVERDPRKNKQKYFTSKSKYGEYTWNNLTITNINYKDRGEYRCIAKNPGGEDEKNITLIVDSAAISGGSYTFSGSTVWIIGLSIGLIILLIVILILVCLFCKKTNHAMNSKRRELGNSSEECINMRGQIEIKKGLITEVNPICKPPRTTVPPSVVSGGTEVSDAKKNLLDNESVFDCDEESRSLDFDQPLLRKSHNVLIDSSDYRLNNPPYPPDLLPFPPRAAQVSPAGSNASTVVIDSRLPAHHGPQSPLHSPIYDQLNLYKTLPYSRSHSPFVQGAAVPRIPRQGAGYVTIPRRPRQSWSSEPPPSSEVVGEPLYDNLGLRTTIDGSSALSLNKIGSETAASTPRSNRVIALSPTPIGPIAESLESSPPTAAHTKSEPSAQSQIPVAQPRPKTPQSLLCHTLPRNINSTKLTPSRTQWAHDNADQLLTPSEKRNSVAGDIPTTEGKPKKIPPRPPPKPKKRLSTGPLFEDEGEDGTEV
ncbi:uncharacterized protein LOC132704757 isoform X2 [Cylas formicarius]|nr:uncharacterized protein LOC132704757 isoform X2 [Cylas formicarius]